MLVELGHFALALALMVAVCQALLPLYGVWTRQPAVQAVARNAAWAQFFLLLFSFLALTWAFLSNDFTVNYVAQQSNTQLPVWYKVSAVWGGHEGSLLLWALVLSAWSAAVARFSRSLPRDMSARVLATLGASMVVCAFRKRDSISRLHSELMRRGMPPVQRWISANASSLKLGVPLQPTLVSRWRM